MFSARFFASLIFLCGTAAALGNPRSSLRPLSLPEDEKQDDPPALVWRTDSSPARVSTHGNFTSYQVNVGANGANITGDAANEPSIAVDPTSPSKMSIGWRQFNSVSSNFRRGGFAYSTNGGTTWTYPGVLDSQFRSDPVLLSDAHGIFFYLSLVPNFYDDIWRSETRGTSWGWVAPALGGDKQWFAIDETNGSSRGFLHQSWSTAGNNWEGRQFTRSTDGGATWMDPIYLPNGPSWGTLAVDTSGNVFIGGAQLSTGWFWCVRSSDAKNPLIAPSFDVITQVDLGGYLIPLAAINPGGLSGQVFLAVDRSGTSTNNNVYMLASVQPFANTNTATHVMFAKSADGAASFSPPRRINTDGKDNGKWHWFGALAVAPNGRIDVVWYDSRNAANNTDSQLFYSYSVDGGESWSSNVSASDLFNPFLGYPNQNKIGDYITIVSDNEAGHVAYCATFNSEQDIYYVRVSPAAADVPPRPLPLRSIMHDPDVVTLTFPTENGRSYQVEYSDVPGPPWQELQTVTGAGSDTAVGDFGVAGKASRFYRVSRLP